MFNNKKNKLEDTLKEKLKDALQKIKDYEELVSLLREQLQQRNEEYNKQKIINQEFIDKQNQKSIIDEDRRKLFLGGVKGRKMQVYKELKAGNTNIDVIAGNIGIKRHHVIRALNELHEKHDINIFEKGIKKTKTKRGGFKYE